MFLIISFSVRARLIIHILMKIFVCILCLLCFLKMSEWVLLSFSGLRSYEKEHWLEAVDHFEEALTLYQEALGDCYLLCEDGIDVNMTQPDMNPQKRALYEEYSLKAEAMEYNEILVAVIKKVQTTSSCSGLAIDVYILWVLLSGGSGDVVGGVSK